MTIDTVKSTQLGVSKENSSLFFTLFSEQISSGLLHLFHPQGGNKIKTVPLQSNHKGVWFAETEIYPPDTEYLFEVDGTLVLDPYAKALSTPHTWGASKIKTRCQLIYDHEFDFERTHKPHIQKEDLIIYEMHVRGFTADPSSKVHHRGTFLGMIEKIPYLKSLGINTVELLPIFEFDETENNFIDPITNKPLCNYWGYSTVNFFCPMKRFATNSDRLTPLTEFKTLVKELHRNGIKIILDVVYNHVSPRSCLDIIDKLNYFILSKGHHTNYTGCGNTVFANGRAGLNLILSSLRYYIEECQVDGFRFDLGGALTKGVHGGTLRSPPLFRTLDTDPFFKDTLFLAEPWDCGHTNLQNAFPSSKVIEWEGNYKRIVRQYVHKVYENTHDFLSCLFPPSTDSLKVHYITCHDGFSLKDLVSYNYKHNERNGEESRDGDSFNNSYNYGVEGETLDIRISILRETQMRNFLFINLFSFGIPMITMGDEFGLTHLGNNNPYCQDGPINWIHWDDVLKNEELVTFTKTAIEVRQKTGLFSPDSQRSTLATSNVHIENRAAAFIVENMYLFVFNPFDTPLDLTSYFSGKWNILLSTTPMQQKNPLLIPTYTCFIAKKVGAE